MHARACRFIGRNTALNLFLRFAKVLADGRSHRRGVDHVLARRRDRERIALLLRRHNAANTVDAEVFDLAHADIAVRRQAASQNVLRQRDGIEQLVVAV